MGLCRWRKIDVAENFPSGYLTHVLFFSNRTFARTFSASWLMKFTTAMLCPSKFVGYSGWLLLSHELSFCLSFGPVESWLLIALQQAQNADQLIRGCSSQGVKKQTFSGFTVPVATVTNSGRDSSACAFQRGKAQIELISKLVVYFILISFNFFFHLQDCNVRSCLCPHRPKPRSLHCVHLQECLLSYIPS